jgi:hypothetical protein
MLNFDDNKIKYKPLCPSSQSQRCISWLHTPWLLLQLFGHTGTSHASPMYDASHVHTPSMHTPLPEQLTFENRLGHEFNLRNNT